MQVYVINVTRFFLFLWDNMVVMNDIFCMIETTYKNQWDGTDIIIKSLFKIMSVY